jgi:hypothetical protein
MSTCFNMMKHFLSLSKKPRQELQRKRRNVSLNNNVKAQWLHKRWNFAVSFDINNPLFCCFCVFSFRFWSPGICTWYTKIACCQALRPRVFNSQSILCTHKTHFYLIEQWRIFIGLILRVGLPIWLRAWDENRIMFIS